MMIADIPDLEHFNHDDAWRMGSAMVERCRSREQGPAVRDY
jgi:hypothetical protein